MLKTNGLIRLLLPLLFLLTNLFPTVGQQEYSADVQYYTTEDGLSHREVNRIFQDSRGFIWFGTKYGLNRFDGHHFEVLTKDKHGLADNKVTEIIEDAEGWLWIFSSPWRTAIEFTHLSFVNVHTLEVKSFEERFGENLPFKIENIYTALPHEGGTIFLGTEDGYLIKFHPTYGFKKHLLKKGVTINLDYKTEDRIVVTTQNSSSKPADIMAIDTTGNIRWSFTGSFDKVFNRTIFNAPKDKLWFYHQYPNTTNATIYHGTGKDKYEPITIQLHKKTTDDIHEIRYRKQDNTLWCASDIEFFRYDIATQSSFYFNLTHPEIANNNVHRIFFDNGNNTWIGTSNGIYRIQVKQSPFRQYLSQPLDEYNIRSAVSSRGIFAKDELMRVNGVELFAPYEVNLKNNTSKKLNNEIYHKEEQESNFINFKVILPLDDNRLLLGGNEQAIYNIKDNTYKYFNWKGLGVLRPASWSLYYDKHRQRYWFGTLNDGLLFSEVGQDSLQYFDHYNEFNNLKKGTIYAFLELDDDHLLIGGVSGIYIMHYEKGIVQEFSTKGKEKTFFPYDMIYHLYKDKKNPDLIWVSTGGGGLIQLQIDTEDLTIKNYEQFTIADGLSSNVIYAAYEDNYENLWLPSDYGIIRFNKISFAAQAFTVKDGLSHHEFNRTAHFQDEEGTLYFGGINGVNVFHPKDVLGTKAKFDMPLQITNFQQFDGQSNTIVNRLTELMTTKRIRLKPSDKFFNLEFALLEYEDGEQVRYSYQIIGQSDEWILLNDNTLRVSGLAYGRYTLNIRGQGVSGQFSEHQISIPIRVVSPFYLRWWFILLIVLTITALIYYWYDRRTHELKNRQAKLEQMVNERTQTIQQQAEELKSLDRLKSRFFANVSHELRTPLTLMLAPIAAALKDRHLSVKTHTNLLLAQKNGERLNRMINEILDLTKLEAGKLELNQEKVVWYNFLRQITSNFESVANQKNIDFQFQYQDKKTLQINLDKSKMEIILLNLLSNAFKFTPKKGKVTITVKEDGEWIYVEISDTGSGIHEADLPHVFDRFYQAKKQSNTAEGGTGIGLALSKEFVNLLDGEITVTSELGKGTIFSIKIPRLEIISQLDTEEALQIKATR